MNVSDAADGNSENENYMVRAEIYMCGKANARVRIKWLNIQAWVLVEAIKLPNAGS